MTSAAGVSGSIEDHEPKISAFNNICEMLNRTWKWLPWIKNKSLKTSMGRRWMFTLQLKTHWWTSTFVPQLKCNIKTNFNPPPPLPSSPSFQWEKLKQYTGADLVKVNIYCHINKGKPPSALLLLPLCSFFPALFVNILSFLSASPPLRNIDKSQYQYG